MISHKISLFLNLDLIQIKRVSFRVDTSHKPPGADDHLDYYYKDKVPIKMKEVYFIWNFLYEAIEKESLREGRRP